MQLFSMIEKYSKADKMKEIIISKTFKLKISFMERRKAKTPEKSARNQFNEKKILYINSFINNLFIAVSIDMLGYWEMVFCCKLNYYILFRVFRLFFFLFIIKLERNFGGR